MTNEWVKSELMGANRDGEPITFTIADGASVSKGDILELSDPATVARFVAEAFPVAVAGIAAEEHVASKGVVTIPVYQNGIFKAMASGAILAGEMLTGGGGNTVIQDAVTGMYASGAIIAKALEDIADGTTGEVRMNL